MLRKSTTRDIHVRSKVTFKPTAAWGEMLWKAILCRSCARRLPREVHNLPYHLFLYLSGDRNVQVLWRVALGARHASSSTVSTAKGSFTVHLVLLRVSAGPAGRGADQEHRDICPHRLGKDDAHRTRSLLHWTNLCHARGKCSAQYFSGVNHR